MCASQSRQGVDCIIVSRKPGLASLVGDSLAGESELICDRKADPSGIYRFEQKGTMTLEERLDADLKDAMRNMEETAQAGDPLA